MAIAPIKFGPTGISSFNFGKVQTDYSFVGTSNSFIHFWGTSNSFNPI